MELFRKLVLSVSPPLDFWARCTRFQPCRTPRGRLLLQLPPNVAAALVSASGPHSFSSKPPRSGDKGPGKNFARKVAKRAKKELKGETVVINDALLDGLKNIELPKVIEQSGQEKLASMKQLLSGIKIKAPTVADKRKQLGMPEKRTVGRDRNVPQIKGAKSSSIDFMNPDGPRLGIFNRPDSTTKVMPPSPPTLAEEERAETLRIMLRLKPRSQFEDILENTAFPRHFPIDNEDYDGKEEGVGFKEHVLLDHLLEGFPKKGPVRHFMELVITGLSKNPSYTAVEKRRFVQSYKEYFSQFSADELQTVTLTKPPA